MDETYETLDIYRAAYLELMGHRVTLSLNRAGRVVFVFSQTLELDEAITRYNEKIFVSARDFAEQIKDLKRRMFSVGNGRRFDDVKQKK